jgi:hypothetical protein
MAANCAFWVYFWVAFAKASQPYDPHPWSHVPIEPYSYWGHAVGSTVSIYGHAFMRIAFWAELPSFGLVNITMRALFGRVPADHFWAGISFPGYKLLAVMVVSFLQWFLIAWAIQSIWKIKSKTLASKSDVGQT